MRKKKIFFIGTDLISKVTQYVGAFLIRLNTCIRLVFDTIEYVHTPSYVVCVI